jgi:membrane associated rhomboid family serine protease
VLRSAVPGDVGLGVESAIQTCAVADVQLGLASMKYRITYNAPVVLTFAIIAVAVHLLGDGFRDYVVMRPRLETFGDFVALFSHIAGHGSWEHLLGNFTLILLLGPILEERHGSGPLLFMILATALVTSLLNLVFFKTYVLGASGIVFMFILLASTANVRKREIPLTFIAVAVLYLGGELVAAFKNDQVSQMAHLIGGLTGAGFGFLGAKGKALKPAKQAPKH